MSSYENYTDVSRNYDRTRIPVGTEIILGCLALSERTRGGGVLLDAGCGTGNYTRAVLPHVGRVEAVDLNLGMLDVARSKITDEDDGHRVGFTQARVDDLPFDDGMFDAVMVNQVLHHLPDDPDRGWPMHQRVLDELARVLRPGGVLLVNTCSQQQLQESYWYYELIRPAADALRERYVPLGELCSLLAAAGFAAARRFVPMDDLVQGPAYFDGRGPLDPVWRAGDSAWSLVEDLEPVLERVRTLDASHELGAFVSAHDEPRPKLGQLTVLAATRA